MFVYMIYHFDYDKVWGYQVWVSKILADDEEQATRVALGTKGDWLLDLEPVDIIDLG